MPKILHFLIVLLLLTLSHQDKPYKKVIPNLDPEARCLDGSPGGLYIHQGSEPKKFLILVIGGGVCAGETLSQTLQQCYKRSKTILGSSTLWPQQVEVGGIASTNPKQNKFAQWTKILFIYCDGTVHQGYKKEPYQYKDSKLYFRGSAITRQHFKWLDIQYKISQAQKVVFTGVSAGGIAVFLWSNYLRQMLKNGTVLDNIIDSGSLVNSTTYPDNKPYAHLVGQNLVKIANVDQGIPLQFCANKYPNQQSKCLVLGLAFTSIEARTLVIDSQYDSEELTTQMKMKCVKEGSSGHTLKGCNQAQMKHIQDNTKARRQVISNLLLFSKNSAWSIACSAHVYLPYPTFYDNQKQRVPMNSKNSVKDAVQRFVFGRQRITEIDQVDYPNNTPCSS